ncbi:hypothetical protein PUN28_005897 [Cardiocondyla obscurior]|uniref:Vitellogenin domain-containing protein n=1 Tax=Cardiocondyla obscurior TaxID=286306 RepID=A0AAW2G6A2_9HYME
MLATILPFFLVANITVNDPHRQSEWATYGPEYTYNVLVNMSLANIVREDDNFCVMMATELKCRPKGEDSLSCRFQNSQIKRPDPSYNRCSNAKDFVPTKYKFVGDEPFEIRFNPKGIENLVVPRSIPRWRLDMIKVIVSQLNVGFEVRERRDKFTIMENSTVGHCEVDVKIIRQSFTENDDDSTEKSESFEIGFMPPGEELGHTSIVERFQVEKVRHPKRCPRRTIYFFGDYEDYSHGDKQVYMDMLLYSKLIALNFFFYYRSLLKD